MAEIKRNIYTLKEKVNSSGDYNILYPVTVCSAVSDLSTKYLPLTGGTITGSIVPASSSVNLGSSSTSFNAIYGYSIYCKGVFADTYISTPYVKVSTAKGLQYYNGTSTWTYTLPAKTGTIALTSDIPTIPTIDTSLSSTSTNPVQNKAVYSVLNKTYVYGMSISGSTLTYNLRNAVTGGTSSSSVTLPSSGSGNTNALLKFSNFTSGTFGLSSTDWGKFSIQQNNGSSIITFNLISIKMSGGNDAKTKVTFNKTFSSIPLVIVSEKDSSNTGSLTYRNNTLVENITTSYCYLKSGKSEAPYVNVLVIGF